MEKKTNVGKYVKKQEFSKTLLIQESALIWVTTLALIYLAFFCIKHQYFGELPWIAAMIGFPWTAYGVSQACYYGKSTKENTKGGIKYDTVVGVSDAEAEYQKQAERNNKICD